MTGRSDASVLDILAAAYAAGGDFGNAVSTAEAAIGLASGDAARAPMRARLQQYRQKQAFRVP
jgi:hypothetical protein